MPVFLIEFRPLRTLFVLFSMRVLMGARHGDPRSIAIAAVYFGLLFWRPLPGKRGKLHTKSVCS